MVYASPCPSLPLSLALPLASWKLFLLNRIILLVNGGGAMVGWVVLVTTVAKYVDRASHTLSRYIVNDRNPIHNGYGVCRSTIPSSLSPRSWPI